MKTMKKIMRVTLLFTAVLMISSIPLFADSKSFVHLKAAKQGETTDYDITGDKKADRIQFEMSNESYGVYKKASIRINGEVKAVLTSDIYYGFFEVDGELITLKNGAKYLQVYGVSEDGHHSASVLFRYKAGKLIKAKDFLSPGFISAWIDSVSGNTITVNFEGLNHAFNRFWVTRKYEYKGGRLEPTSESYYFHKNPISEYRIFLEKGPAYKLCFTMQGYASMVGNEKLFTAKKGTMVTFLNYYPGKTPRVYVKLSNGKKCWLKVPKCLMIEGTLY